MLTSVAVLVTPGVTPFELGILCEVFGIDRTGYDVPRIDFRICGPTAGRSVPTSVGAGVVPDRGVDGLHDADLIAVPATQSRIFDDALLDALRCAAGAGAGVLSVCTGAFVLGSAGLLDDRPCTTHWRRVDELARTFPRADVRPNVLFVDDGDVVTSAGTASGIDACLHVVRRELGGEVANTIAQHMLVSLPRDGDQRQIVDRPMADAEVGLGPVIEWAMENIGTPLTVSDMARQAQMSDRTFARRFVAEIGMTPYRWLTAQRVLRAQQLLEETELGVEEIADRSGFGSGDLLRYHLRKSMGQGPLDLRRRFRRSQRVMR